MLASDNELHNNPTNFDNATPEVEEDATAVEVSLTQMAGDGIDVGEDTPRPSYDFSLRKLAYLSMIVAAFASTIAVVSKVQNHQKTSAQMMLKDECGDRLSPLVVSKPLTTTPLDEVVPVPDTVYHWYLFVFARSLAVSASFDS